MSIIRSLLQKMQSQRLLYAQLLFTALAFSMMIGLSYMFMSDIVHSHLLQNTHNSLNAEQAKIATDLLEFKTALSAVSRIVRNIVLRHSDIAEVRLQINELSAHARANIQHTSASTSFFAFLETLPDGTRFISDMTWNPPENFISTATPWIQAAIAANEGIAETVLQTDILSEQAMLIFTRCIFDDAGRRLGVVGLRTAIAPIGAGIVDSAFAQGSYGMLLSKDLIILTHPNPNIVGKSYRALTPSVVKAVDDLNSGMEVSGRPVTNYRDGPALAFFRHLPNGWHLGIVVPSAPYYQSVRKTALILTTLGALLAALLGYGLVRIDAARRKADEVSRQKSNFLASMSHEIRTPMNAIIGMTVIGKSAASIERKDYCLTKIEDASQHLLGVINDVLDISKIEANKFELLLEAFHFETMLQRVVNVVNFRVSEKRLKLMVHIDHAIPHTLVGDDQRLAQVITNLLGNAVKFTPEQGSVHLDARLSGETEGVCTLQCAVTDSGIGISPERQARLFQSFQQVDAGISRKYGGTGLGLAISKRIVEMMGGTIWVESELGKGATFAFTVQLKRCEEKGYGLSDLGVHWDNLRILIADDDPDVLLYFKEIMQKFGVSCDTAASGEDALRLVEQEGRYNIYFVDWAMSGMNGIDLTRALKEKASSPDHAVIIMISSAELSAVEEEARQAGVDKFLSKPLFPSAIAEIINTALGLDQRQTFEEQSDIAGLFAERHMLLVEDVEINREIALTLLEPTLIKIDCAENGVEAVRMFSEAPEKYDVILMDVQMPEMDGYEATRRIRAMDVPNAQTIPILAMTAHVFREDIEKSIQAGMNSHLGKPLNYDDVLQTLREYLS